jgi:hypothetical protein
LGTLATGDTYVRDANDNGMISVTLRWFGDSHIEPHDPTVYPKLHIHLQLERPRRFVPAATSLVTDKEIKYLFEGPYGFKAQMWQRIIDLHPAPETDLPYALAVANCTRLPASIRTLFLQRQGFNVTIQTLISRLPPLPNPQQPPNLQDRALQDYWNNLTSLISGLLQLQSEVRSLMVDKGLFKKLPGNKGPGGKRPHSSNSQSD